MAQLSISWGFFHSLNVVQQMTGRIDARATCHILKRSRGRSRIT
jgi:hypothetical protein